MASHSEILVAAGNTEIPAYLTIQSLGFTIIREELDGNEEWIATSPDLKVMAGSLLELLGLLTMRRERGRDWQATDEEIDTFLATFHSEASDS
jgi:hypothetical protein